MVDGAKSIWQFHGCRHIYSCRFHIECGQHKIQEQHSHLTHARGIELNTAKLGTIEDHPGLELNFELETETRRLIFSHVIASEGETVTCCDQLQPAHGSADEAIRQGRALGHLQS